MGETKALQEITEPFQTEEQKLDEWIRRLKRDLDSLRGSVIGLKPMPDEETEPQQSEG